MIQVRFPKPFQTALRVPFPEGSAAIPDVKTWGGGRGGESSSFQEAGGGRETSWEKPSTRLEFMANYHA